ncbi:MAG: hypothetical protein JST80_10475 [Bdellovibrionales bacterium]|nr:hypothetical protein [Bdellovibrionales bacterium]
MSKSKNYTFIMGFIVAITTFSPYAVAGLKASDGSNPGVKCKLSKYNKERFTQSVAVVNTPVQQQPAGKANKAI